MELVNIHLGQATIALDPNDCHRLMTACRVMETHLLGFVPDKAMLGIAHTFHGARELEPLALLFGALATLFEVSGYAAETEFEVSSNHRTDLSLEAWRRDVSDTATVVAAGGDDVQDTEIVT